MRPRTHSEPGFPSREQRPSHESKADQLTDRELLMRRIDSFSSYHQTIDSLNPEATEQEVLDGLQSALHKAEAVLPPDKRALADDYEKKLGWLKQLDWLGPLDESDPNDEANILNRRQVQEELEAMKLEEDDDLRHILSLRNNNRLLTEKHRTIKALQKSSEFMLPKVITKKFRGADMDKLILNREYGLFEVVLTVSPKVLDAVSANIKKVRTPPAAYVNGTPFILVREDLSGQEKKALVEHEKVHNFLDGLWHIEHHDYTTPLLKELKRVAAKNPESVKEEKGRIPEVDEFIDAEHNELMAELGSIENEDFRYGQKLFDRLAGLSTAGIQWWKVMHALRNEALKLPKNDPRRDKLLLRKKLFTNRIEMTLNRMRMALKTAEQLQPREESGKSEAVEYVHELLIMLKPSQYDQLQDLLAAKYGQVEARGAYSAQRIIAERNLSPATVREMAKLLHSQPEIFTTEQLNQMIDVVVQRSEENDSFGNCQSVAQVMSYETDLRLLASKVKRFKEINEVIEKIWHHNLANLVRKSFGNELQDLQSMFDQLFEEQQVMMRDELIQQVLQAKKEKRLGQLFNIKHKSELARSPAWKAIRDVGWAQDVRRVMGII